MERRIRQETFPKVPENSPLEVVQERKELSNERIKEFTLIG